MNLGQITLAQDLAAPLNFKPITHFDLSVYFPWGQIPLLWSKRVYNIAQSWQNVLTKGLGSTKVSINMRTVFNRCQYLDLYQDPMVEGETEAGTWFFISFRGFDTPVI